MDIALSIFYIGTLWFWLFWVAATIVIIASLETDHYGWGNFFAFLGALVLYDNYHRADNPLTLKLLLIYIGLYFLAGAIWSLFKWWRHCKQAVAAANHDIGDHPKENFDYDWFKRDLECKMSAGNNKGRICAWIAYWPWSFIWNISRDIINTIFDALKGLYEHIASSVLGELKTIPPAPKK